MNRRSFLKSVFAAGAVVAVAPLVELVPTVPAAAAVTLPPKQVRIHDDLDLPPSHPNCRCITPALESAFPAMAAYAMGDVIEVAYKKALVQYQCVSRGST